MEVEVVGVELRIGGEEALLGQHVVVVRVVERVRGRDVHLHQGRARVLGALRHHRGREITVQRWVRAGCAIEVIQSWDDGGAMCAANGVGTYNTQSQT